MSDQKMIEIAWNVLYGRVKELAATPPPTHALATPGKRSVRQHHDRFARHICSICRRNSRRAHTLSSFAGIVRDKRLTRQTLSLIKPNHIEELRAQGFCAGIREATWCIHQYVQLSFGELTTCQCLDCCGPTDDQLTTERKRIDLKARLTASVEFRNGRGAIASIYLDR